jgi:hypothetical protein
VRAVNRAAVAAELQALTTQAERELGLEAFDVSLAQDGVLVMLRVPKGARLGGRGTEAMARLTRFADQHGLRIAMNLASPADGYGTTSKMRLVRFYKRFGFRENKGAQRDFTISYAFQMLREPKAALARRGNPVAATHHHIWSCPSGPENVVFFLRDHYETESEERILRAGGGWRKVAGDMYFAGGWQTKREFVKDWSINWYRVENPDGGLPIYVIAASHVENVFAPEGVDVDDLVRWAQAWEDEQA